MNQTYYVYILECVNAAYYTGYTTDLQRRYQEHQQGTAASKFTRSFPPKRLAAAWQIEGSKSDAMRLEAYIKQKTKLQKQQFIEQPAALLKLAKQELNLTLTIGE